MGGPLLEGGGEVVEWGKMEQQQQEKEEGPLLGKGVAVAAQAAAAVLLLLSVMFGGLDAPATFSPSAKGCDFQCEVWGDTRNVCENRCPVGGSGGGLMGEGK
jgi:hypothetical protein